MRVLGDEGFGWSDEGFRWSDGVFWVDDEVFGWMMRCLGGW